MFKRLMTATKLRDQANQDDQMARELLVQVAEANIRARERRDEAVTRDGAEARARLYAMMFGAEQVWRTADADAKSANEDAQTSLAIATQAQGDFEAAAGHEAETFKQYQQTKDAYEAFCKTHCGEDNE